MPTKDTAATFDDALRTQRVSFHSNARIYLTEIFCRENLIYLNEFLSSR